MNRLSRFVLAVFFLPILISIDIFRSPKTVFKKIIYFLVVWLFLGTVWFRGYKSIIDVARISLYELGITDKVSHITVYGTSMLPTIQDGETVTLHNPKKYGIERGDIVSFQNIETGNLHYLKRVIGLEQEEIVIINGVVKIDGQALEESYVHHREPTFGNTFLVECEPQTIPLGKVAVLGDNRIVSSDSRAIGFIDQKDIEGVIKTGEKPEMKSSLEGLEPKEIEINPDIFLEKLNAAREKSEVRPLEVKPLLSQVAGERAKAISADFEGWKQQAMPIGELLEKVGYQYLLAQEMVTFGYLDEQQIVEQITESFVYKDVFLSKRYYEVGIGTTLMQKGQCRFPIIVAIIGWPTHPAYSQQTINVWKQNLDLLSQIISALKELRNYPEIDRQQTQELIDEFSRLLEMANRLSLRVEQGEWLTEGEYQLMEEYYEKSQQVGEKLEIYFQTYQQSLAADSEIKKAFTQFFPGDSEFNQKSHETKLLFGQGKYQEQLKSAQELLPLAQNDSEKAIAHYWLGLALYKLKRPAEAKDNLIKATQLDNQYSGPLVTLAAISFEEQNYQEGLDYSLRCVALDPDYAWCHNDLGLAYLYLGDKQKGIAELEKAVSLDPTSYVFNDNLNRAKK